MDRRSRDLQSRISDVRRRLRAMRTVTNTSSAQIEGGETVIDEDGGLIFGSGGRLTLGGSTIADSTGEPIISREGVLSVDSFMVYGDVLSASDYLFQREVFEIAVVDTTEVGSLIAPVEMNFPDWSSSALADYSITLNTRIPSINSNKVTVYLNGKPVARPRSNSIGDVYLNSFVTRRHYPDDPTPTIEVVVDEEVLPTIESVVRITTSGVYTA